MSRLVNKGRLCLHAPASFEVVWALLRQYGHAFGMVKTRV